MTDASRHGVAVRSSRARRAVPWQGSRNSTIIDGLPQSLLDSRHDPALPAKRAQAARAATLQGEPMYQHVKVPAAGQKITVNKDFSLNVPDNPIIPYIEGDGTGVDITPVMIRVVDAAVAKAYGGKRKIHWMEIYAGEKSTQGLRARRLAPRRDARDRSRLRRLDQRAADHAGRRRHPLAQRRAAPAARSLRLPAPGPLLRRRAEPRQGAREDQYGDLPRELRGHLCGHRVGGRIGGREEAGRFPDPGDGRQEDPLSRQRRGSASSRCRARAPSD